MSADTYINLLLSDWLPKEPHHEAQLPPVDVAVVILRSHLSDRPNGGSTSATLPLTNKPSFSMSPSSSVKNLEIQLSSSLRPVPTVWTDSPAIILCIIPRPAYFYRGNICKCSPCTYVYICD